MKLYFSVILLIINVIHALDGFKCDLGSSDIIFLVKASHHLDREAFLNFKEFLKRFSNGLDLGRSSENTQTSIIFFDNIKKPVVKVEFSAYARFSDLSFAIDNLKKLPCGTAWCKEQYNGNQNALEFALQQFPSTPGRMKKVVIIQKGQTYPEDTYFQRMQTDKDHNLKILEISVRHGVMTYNNDNYNYYASYNDNYKRYMSRYAQLYPNVSIPQPALPSAPDYGTQAEDGRIVISDSLDVLKLKELICDQIFSCPVCASEEFNFEVSDHTASPTLTEISNEFEKPNTLSTQSETSKPQHSDDYEYEIVANPPGMKINMNPAKDVVDMMRTTVSTSEYEYEDENVEKEASTDARRPTENSSNLGERKKRQANYGARRQSDCSCSVAPAQKRVQASPYIPTYNNPYNTYHTSYYSTPCNAFYPCVQSTCFAPFYSNCARPFYQPFYYGSIHQQPNYVYPSSQIQIAPAIQNDVSQEVLNAESNDQSLNLNDGTTSGLGEKDTSDLLFSESVIDDGSNNVKTLRRIGSIDPVLPDLFKPKAVTLNQLLSPISSTSNTFLTHGIQLNSRKREGDDGTHERDLEESSVKIPDLSSKVKKPDGGSSLTHLDGLKSRRKRSYGLFMTPWSSAVPDSSHSHPRVHGVSTYLVNQNDKMNCTIRGTDIVLYVDDVSAMQPSSFELVKSTISNLYSLFENNANTCNQVSRLCLMKTVPAEEVKTVLNFPVSITSKYENDFLIRSLSYGGCDVRRLQCENTLANAVVIGSNLLTIENNDREKILILISSRNMNEIKTISTHLVQAQEFARKNNVNVIHVSPENGSRGVFSPTLRLKSLISTVCSLSPKMNSLRSKSTYCPWS